MENSMKETAKSVLLDALVSGSQIERRGIGKLSDIMIAMAQVSSTFFLHLGSSTHDALVNLVGTLDSHFALLHLPFYTSEGDLLPNPSSRSYSLLHHRTAT
jgi:hypothetical protein